MPLFSMRRSGDAGIGDLLALEQWVDWAAAHRVGFLQILPVNALGRDDVPSPYSAISSVALEPLYLSPERVPGMPEHRDLYPEEAPPLQRPGGRDWVDYARVRQYKDYWLRRAWERFEREAAFAPLRAVCAAWCAEQGSWLEDFAAFVVASTAFGTVAWWHWPEQNPDVIRHYAHATAVADAAFRYTCWLQWLCAREWAMVRAHADAAGVQLMGDVPIGVSAASADVFFERHLFDLSWSGGAPAEGNFAEDPFTAKWGQNWGIPLYRWEVMAQDGYAWWVRRLAAAGELYDIVRMDHFRGLEAYWSIPYGDETAKGGRWCKGPGMDFVRAVKNSLPELNMIAEDLGFLTQEVLDLRDASGYPGMKVLEFAFDSREPSDYLPHTYVSNTVCYTGTHDNMTMRQWFETASADAVAYATEYMSLTEQEGLVWGVIRTAFASVSDYCVIQMQDLLNLGGEARMNFPGTLSDSNWTWRAKDDIMSEALAKRILSMTKLYGRYCGK